MVYIGANALLRVLDPARVPRPGAVDENPSCAHVVGLSLVIVAVLQFDATVDRSHAVKFGSRTGGTLALGDAGKIAGPSLCAGPGRGSPPLTPLESNPSSRTIRLVGPAPALPRRPR